MTGPVTLSKLGRIVIDWPERGPAAPGVTLTISRAEPPGVIGPKAGADADRPAVVATPPRSTGAPAPDQSMSNVPPSPLPTCTLPSASMGVGVPPLLIPEPDTVSESPV